MERNREPSDLGQVLHQVQDLFVMDLLFSSRDLLVAEYILALDLVEAVVERGLSVGVSSPGLADRMSSVCRVVFHWVTRLLSILDVAPVGSQFRGSGTQKLPPQKLCTVPVWIVVLLRIRVCTITVNRKGKCL